MDRLIRLFVILFLLNLPACQLYNKYMQGPSKPEPKIQVEAVFSQQQLDQQAQVYELFLQGMRYQQLGKQEQLALCKKLNIEYQSHQQWQTAWLLVYSLNTGFSCLNQNKTLALMKEIQTNQETNKQLIWLINNRIRLFSKFENKNVRIQRKLNKKTVQLEQVNSKIQALKTIETNINKKLDDK